MTKRALNLFTSYSHLDETHFKNFKKHLVTLKRNGVINAHDDYMLIAGDDVDSELYKMIEKSDLVVFLISIDFLNSEYCYNKELKQALDKLENGEVRIVPVVVEKCKWQDTILGKYLSATKNGVPVSKYKDENDAWCEVIESIEKSYSKFHETSTNIKKKPEKQFSLTKYASRELNNTEVVFNHRFKDKLYLDDIYTYPELKVVSKELDDLGDILDAKVISSREEIHSKLLIIGSEQSGKTALAKTLFKDFYGNDQLPILFNATNISKTDTKKILKKLLSEQYTDCSLSKFISSNRNKVLIVDDFNSINLNAKFQKNLLNNAEKYFNEIIIFSDTSIRFNESRYVELSSYSQYEILLFNNCKRGELIEKWNTIGQEETIDLTLLHNNNDQTICNVDGIVRKKVLPSKPLYILTIIQTLDTSKANDHSLTSYGHCYQSLIQKNLDSAKIKSDEFDQFNNYLSEIAYFIFKTGKESISLEELQDFKQVYSSNYVIESHSYVVDSLIKSGIIKKINNSYRYSYRYIFYFYVAKYISDHIKVESCKKDIKRLCNNLHTEKNSNILIFLVHHSKDQFIIDELLISTWSIFENFEPTKLDQQETSYLGKFVKNLPELVIDKNNIKQRSIEQARSNKLKKRDAIDRLEESEPDEEKDENVIQRADDDKQLSTTDKTLSEINSSVRSVEIIGQILRNRHGSLKIDQLSDLTSTAFDSGLKFLKFFIEETDNNQDLIIDIIDELIRDKSDLTDEKVTKHARSIFLYMCYTTLSSVISKITQSIGTSKLIPVFEDIAKNNSDSPAIQLILISIHLEFNKKIPKKEIESFFIKYKENDITKRLLQEIVIQHMYYNHIEYQDRQWISSKLDLPIKAQRRIQKNLENNNIVRLA